MMKTILIRKTGFDHFKMTEFVCTVFMWRRHFVRFKLSWMFVYSTRSIMVFVWRYLCDVRDGCSLCGNIFVLYAIDMYVRSSHSIFVSVLLKSLYRVRVFVVLVFVWRESWWIYRVGHFLRFAVHSIPSSYRTQSSCTEQYCMASCVVYHNKIDLHTVQYCKRSV